MTEELVDALLGRTPQKLSENVSLATPLTLARMTGRSRVSDVLTAYAATFDRPELDLEVKGDTLEGGAFTATTDGNAAQVLLLASRDDAGLISRIDMYGRPWPYMALLRDRLAPSNPALVDAAIGETPYVPEGPGEGTIDPPPVPPLAEDVAFHSPILTATAIGKAANERILTAAAEVYGEATYRAVLQVLGAPAVAVLYDGTVNDNAIQVAAIFTLNAGGEVNEIRIFSRPWPITAYFRKGMYELLSDLLGPEYWQGPNPTGPLPVT